MINISADKHSAASEQTPGPEMALVYVGLRFTKSTLFFGRRPGAYSHWNTEPSEPWQPVSPDFEPLRSRFYKGKSCPAKSLKKRSFFRTKCSRAGTPQTHLGRFGLIQFKRDRRTPGFVAGTR